MDKNTESIINRLIEKKLREQLPKILTDFITKKIDIATTMERQELKKKRVEEFKNNIQNK